MARPARWPEFEGAHAARAEVGEPVKRRDRRLGYAFARHPGVDQRIAEVVGQGVGEHRRQALVGGFGEERENVQRLADRHGQRCELDAARLPLRVVFKDVVTEAGVDGNAADGGAPGADFDEIDRAIHGLLLGLALARTIDALAWRRLGARLQKLHRADAHPGGERLQPVGSSECSRDLDQRLD